MCCRQGMLAWSVQNVWCNFMSRESLAINRNSGMVQTDIHDSVALLNTIFFTKPWHDTDDKEISHPKTEKCWKFIQAMPDVDEFVSSSEQIWRNLALHHLFTSGSSTVNGSRQNEKHENISSPYINVLWSEKLHACKKDFSPDSNKMTFSLVKAILWIML